MAPQRMAGGVFGLNRNALGMLMPQLSGIAMEKLQELGKGSHGPAQRLLSTLQSGRISASDATGSVRVGPDGFHLSRAGANGEPAWELEASLPQQGATYRSGDFSIGGSWGNGNPSARIAKGPITIEGGYRRAPGAGGLQDAGAAKSEGWGQVSFKVGAGNRGFGGGPIDGQSAVFAADQAVAPFVQPQSQEVALPTPGQELEAMLQSRRQRDPNWYRP